MTQNHLKKVRLCGFKSIKELDLEMNSVNILIGANGSGKSNFISLFTFLRNLSDGKLRSYVEKNGYASTFFHFGPKITPQIAIDIRVGVNGYHVDFVHGEHDDSLVFENEYCTYFKSRKKFDVKGTQGESGLLPGSKSDSKKVRKFTRKYMKKCRVYHFHDTSPTAAFKQARKINSSSFLHPDAANLASILYNIRENHADDYYQILLAIRTVAPFFHDFYLEPQGKAGDKSLLLRWSHRDHSEPFSANQLSDGTARFICLVTLFLQPEQYRPYTIVLDEPELGLHPDAIEVLAEIIKSVSETTQVIVSTQSVELANYFEPEDFIVTEEVGGSSVFKKLDRKPLEVWLDEYKMGHIWTKNLIGGNPKC